MEKDIYENYINCFDKFLALKYINVTKRVCTCLYGNSNNLLAPAHAASVLYASLKATNPLKLLSFTPVKSFTLL